MKMTIGKKLMLSFGGMLALTLGLAWGALSSIGTMSGLLDSALTKTAKKLDLASDMEASANDLIAGQRGVMLFSMLKDQAKAEKARALYESNMQDIEKDLAEVAPLLNTDRGRRAIETIQTGTAGWKPVFQEIIRLSAAARFSEMNGLIEKAASFGEEVKQASADLQQVSREQLAEAQKEAGATTARSRYLAFVLIGICLGVGGVVVWLVRQTSVTLQKLSAEMADGAEQVAAAASQVSSSSQSLAQGSSEQAASIEETSASSEEINSMARKNAENSKTAAGYVEEAGQRVAEANRNLELMVTSMNEINTSSDKISKIIKVIDEIAFQTNILALNAAVEAARAGEAGMGFAVVADEVRNLAQRCAQAAKDTAGLIEESIAKSNDGKAKLDQVATAVRSITEVAEKVKTLVDEVHLGSQEQARGIEQVSKAITQMEKVTQTTAASAEESASASEELSAQSDTLNGIVDRLNEMVGGGGSGSNGARHHVQRQNRSRGHVSVASHAAKSGVHGAVETQVAELPTAAPARSSFPLEQEFKEF